MDTPLHRVSALIVSFGPRQMTWASHVQIVVESRPGFAALVHRVYLERLEAFGGDVGGELWHSNQLSLGFATVKHIC